MHVQCHSLVIRRWAPVLCSPPNTNALAHSPQALVKTISVSILSGLDGLEPGMEVRPQGMTASPTTGVRSCPAGGLVAFNYDELTAPGTSEKRMIWSIMVACRF